MSEVKNGGKEWGVKNGNENGKLVRRGSVEKENWWKENLEKGGFVEREIGRKGKPVQKSQHPLPQ
ncbi:TPA: hypothetical protein HA338_07725 [Methanosarcina acetivorans]|uniref:Uncharacterized protein n=1 Tax=Methanosarcina acetivorans TaxID=2214 RepID=A0A832SJ24_9EURY|nr:hypothetical protein [Methanosarcina acetivorans]HIH93922.1 hypothetical protein [Methanosarcina acetivorans]